MKTFCADFSQHLYTTAGHVTQCVSIVLCSLRGSCVYKFSRGPEASQVLDNCTRQFVCLHGLKVVAAACSLCHDVLRHDQQSAIL